MTKAQYILLCIIAERKLKDICEQLGLSYKFIYAVGKGTCKPSFKAKQGLLPLIEPDYWYEEADEDFKKIYTFPNSFLID